MKISNEHTHLAYIFSKKVFEGNLTSKEAVKNLVSVNNMNPNSAADYINNFRCMLEGRRFTRTQNGYSMEYFLENIFHDYGSTGLSRAICALRQHIEYYESIQKGNMKSMRKIYNKYSEMLTESYNDDFEQNELIKVIKKKYRSRYKIIQELKNIKSTDPEELVINRKSFKRDNRTIALIKILRKEKCQICSATIKKKDGTFYIEAAHIEPKHRRGRETPDNILLLCPNHHKEFDYGDRNILLHDKLKVHFTLNGQEHQISLKIE